MKIRSEQEERAINKLEPATSPNSRLRDLTGNKFIVSKADILGSALNAPHSPSCNSLLKRFHALCFSLFTSIVLHLFFRLLRAKFSAGYIHLDFVPAILNSAVVSILWIKLYQWFTKERGINPFVVIGITLGSPFVAEWVEKGVLWNGTWEAARRIEGGNN